MAQARAGVKPAKKRRNRQRFRRAIFSVFIRPHDGDGRLRVLNVQRATGRNQLDQLGAVVVVADIQGHWQAVGVAMTTSHPKWLSG